MPDNYTVIYKNLPYKIFGFTIYNGEDDYYTIYINIRHSVIEQKRTFKHEINHIISNDFKRIVNVNNIEFLR